jgi:hypothetical protein
VSEEEREYLNETIRNLNNQLIDALRERDSVRRDRCYAICVHDKKNRSPQKIAQDMGWDCFKETSQ